MPCNEPRRIRDRSLLVLLLALPSWICGGRRRRRAVVGPIFSPLTASGGQIVFSDVAAESGITYRRGASLSEALFDVIRSADPYTFLDLIMTPVKSRGAPGVVVFDYDRDGDLDLFATNGPGRDNSLYQNQLSETGSVSFVDVAVAAGVGALDQDATGACAGDIDNDGDQDLYVLGNKEPNRLFENLGDGTFLDISLVSGAAGDHRTSSSCSMGDLDTDGLLDIAYANVFDLDTQQAIVTVPFALNQPNGLLRNQGGNIFVDVAASSGFLDLAIPGFPGVASISWAVVFVDLDMDGDVDLMHADDGGAFPRASAGGIDRAFNHFFENDGTGHFINRTSAVGLAEPGGWMGLSFGDFDCNGRLDFFSTNFGNHQSALASGRTDFSQETGDSRWFLQQSDGTFIDSSASGPIHSPFGWGTSAADYDNDGDTDILFHGGLDVGSFVAASPAVVLENDGQANFQRDALAFASSTDHQRRTVHGMAVGDIDNNGFIDAVSVSAFDFPAPFPLAPMTPLGNPAFDVDAFFFLSFRPDPSAPPGIFAFLWNGFEPPDGTLSVELSSGNGNRWVQVELQGTIGQTTAGRVNRDGIGAVITFTPFRGSSVLLPVLGGSSYASQDSLIATFGLGEAFFGRAEVLWPGGVRNRLYAVRHARRILFPEIPCSFDDPILSLGAYIHCVDTALDELIDADILSGAEAARFGVSALLAFLEERFP